jgi:hypothetical protein
MMTTNDRLMAWSVLADFGSGLGQSGLRWSVVGGWSEGGDGRAAVHVPVVGDVVVGRQSSVGDHQRRYSKTTGRLTSW